MLLRCRPGEKLSDAEYKEVLRHNNSIALERQVDETLVMLDLAPRLG